jgi:hypothetical protein
MFISIIRLRTGFIPWFFTLFSLVLYLDVRASTTIGTDDERTYWIDKNDYYYSEKGKRRHIVSGLVLGWSDGYLILREFKPGWNSVVQASIPLAYGGIIAYTRNYRLREPPYNMSYGRMSMLNWAHLYGYVLGGHLTDNSAYWSLSGFSCEMLCRFLTMGTRAVRAGPNTLLYYTSFLSYFTYYRMFEYDKKLAKGAFAPAALGANLGCAAIFQFIRIDKSDANLVAVAGLLSGGVAFLIMRDWSGSSPHQANMWLLGTSMSTAAAALLVKKLIIQKIF